MKAPELGWRPPRAGRSNLENGLRLWHIERESFPYETVHLVLHAGGHADSPSLRGCATLTADLLDCGTHSATALEISAALERMGSHVAIRGGLDGTTITLSSLHRHLPDSLKTLGEILRAPSFPPEELERVRKRRISSLEHQRQRPAAVAALVLQRVLYGDAHPYGSDPAGSATSLGSITREDCAAFHASHLRPGRSTLFLLGRTGEDEGRRLLEEALNGWDGRAPEDRTPDPPPATAPEVVIIDRPGSAQSEIRLGAPGIKRHHPAFFASVLMSRILGGEFNSRLNANLREQKGFTYGVWSSFGFGKFGGPFQVGTAVATSVTGEALGEIFSELEKMRTGGVTEEETRRAREGTASGFALAFETPSQIALIYQNAPLYGFSEDYYDSYLDLLGAVGSEQVTQAARDTLDLHRMKVVVVGDASAILPQLGSGEFTPRVCSLADLGL
jgi:zinc protease